ncbi:MAG TPA: hypothetical protein VIU37_06250 [Candidatus Limnocylindrales bacterium]
MTRIRQCAAGAADDRDTLSRDEGMIMKPVLLGAGNAGMGMVG